MKPLKANPIQSCQWILCSTVDFTSRDGDDEDDGDDDDGDEDGDENGEDDGDECVDENGEDDGDECVDENGDYDSDENVDENGDYDSDEDDEDFGDVDGEVDSDDLDLSLTLHSSPCCLWSPSRPPQSVLSFSTVDPSSDDPSSHPLASAVATCGQDMRQLRTIGIYAINLLPLFRALEHRESPLECVIVDCPLWVCTVLVWVCSQDWWYNALMSEVGIFCSY